MATIMPANVHLQFRKEEANLLLLAVKAGIVGLGSFQHTMEQCFMQLENRERHNEMMNKIFKLEDELVRQIMKETKKEEEANGHNDNRPIQAEGLKVQP